MSELPEPKRRIFSAPKSSGKGSGPSYFKIAKAQQEANQAKIFEKSAKTAKLPLDLANAAHSLAGQFIEEVGDHFKTDCREGCSFCCYQPATAFPFEAIRIAEVLKRSLSTAQLQSLKEKMKLRVQGLEGASVRQSINNKAACPLLVDQRCSVYADRPLTCRMAHSFSVKRCQQAFERDRSRVEIPYSPELLSGISGIIEGAFEKLPQKKVDGNLYELCSAVLAVLSDPEAPVKWASGDLSVFKSCVKDDT